jgi:NADH:ubiquinone oxidoreductase subunit K
MYQGGKTILKRYGAYGAVVIFALVISFPVLRNGFVNYDDPSLVLEPAEKGKLDLKYWNMVEVFLPHPGASYTPIRTLTFVVCHAIGGEAPYIYHLASLFLYLLLCLAVYLFARCLLSWEEGSELPPAGYLARGNFWALLAAFVFTAHPLNVESLAWVSAVKDLFLALFTLACLLSFIYMEKGWEAGKKLTLVFFVLALVSKPSALMLPLVLAVYRWCRPSISMRLGLPRAFMISAVILISAYSIYLIPFLSFFEIYRHSGGPGSVISGALKVFFLYLKAFLLPLNLSVRYLVRVPLNFCFCF